MKRPFMVLIALMLLPLSCWAENPSIGILVFDKVLTSDVTAPAEVFGVASRKAWFKDYDVLLIGVENKSSVTTEEGLVLTVDYTIHNAPALNALIVPSAYDMKALLKNQDLTQFLQRQAKQASWLASNCSGAFLLANAGLLDGIHATTWSGGESNLQRDFPAVKVIHDQNVVVDGRVITSNGSLISYQSALVLLAKMSHLNKARQVFESLQMQRIMDWSLIATFYNSAY
jgi:transcriptional regulator GlxA family with amidase domain